MPDDLSTGKSGVLKSYTIFGIALLHVFNSISLLFMKLCAQDLGAYMLNVVIFLIICEKKG